MKTEQEWCKEFYREFGAVFTGHGAFIKKIQNDARKALAEEITAVLNRRAEEVDAQCLETNTGQDFREAANIVGDVEKYKTPHPGPLPAARGEGEGSAPAESPNA